VNAANEITGITGSGQGDWVDAQYDRAGNMKAMPLAGSETDRVFATYDAWNRLRKVYEDTNDDGQFEPSDAPGGGDDTLLVTYEYDATGRRIEKETTEDAPGGERDLDYYFNADWQLLESETVVSGNTSVDQYVWSATYVDAPVGRWHDANGDGDYVDEGENIRYFTRDANFNVTATIEGTYDAQSQDWTWQLAERYMYSPYGEATVYDADWSAGSAQAPTTDGPLYCGYFFDADTALYNVRWRIYHSTLSTWLTRDPMGYSAGDANLYRYVGNRPLDHRDARGTKACCTLVVPVVLLPSFIFYSHADALHPIVPVVSFNPSSVTIGYTRDLVCCVRRHVNVQYNCTRSFREGFLWLKKKTINFRAYITQTQEEVFAKKRVRADVQVTGNALTVPVIPGISAGVAVYQIHPADQLRADNYCREHTFDNTKFKPPAYVELP